MWLPLTVCIALQTPAIQWITPEVRAPKVTQHIFDSKAAKAKVSYHVYLPKAYQENPSKRFPVLYWLHGSGGGLPGIRPVSAFFDQAIEAGKIPPMLIAFPNSFANGMWCDSADGMRPIETIFIKELIPDFDRKFRTIARKEGRILEGFSMGGYGAGRLGFKFPKMFGGISMLAAGPLDLELMGPKAAGNPAGRERILQSVYGGKLETFKAQSPWMFAQSNAKKIDKSTKIRICIGSEDFTLPANREFSGHLKQLGIAHEFQVVPKVGHDTIALLTSLGESNWSYYNTSFSDANKTKK